MDSIFRLIWKGRIPVPVKTLKGGQASAILQNSCLCENIYLNSRSPMVCKYNVTVIPVWILLENLDIIDQLIYIQLIYRLRVLATPQKVHSYNYYNFIY